MNVIITGGAGFVGCSLALHFKEKYPQGRVVVFDNLHRRGSEQNLSRLQAQGIQFIHGDIRIPGDFDQIQGNFDLFVECSAEPSVLSGVQSGPGYILQTNLVGTIHCLDWARLHAPNLVFLSTSRVYSIGALRQIPLEETATRFELKPELSLQGLSKDGIAESFSTTGYRSFYGTSKLSSEMILEEYSQYQGLNAVINRCGVIAGPGQFGKVDQGVLSYWVLQHCLERPLKFTGFGGTGKQVRDFIHPDDIFSLVHKQAEIFPKVRGQIFNIGGGSDRSVSLAELTGLCREFTGNQVTIASEPETHAADVPFYVSDSSKAASILGWRPQRSLHGILKETVEWTRAHLQILSQLN